MSKENKAGRNAILAKLLKANNIQEVTENLQREAARDPLWLLSLVRLAMQQYAVIYNSDAIQQNEAMQQFNSALTKDWEYNNDKLGKTQEHIWPIK